MLDALKRFANEHILADGAQVPLENGSAPPVRQPATLPSASAGPSDNPFIDLLRQAVKARNSPYTSLQLAIDKLSMIPDPTVRTQAAFATIQGEGRGAREVLQAVDVHLQDLESQKMQFSQAVERQRTAALGALQSELDSIAPANAAAQQQIEQLSQQINNLTQQIGQRNARAGEVQAQIATEGQRFTLQGQQFEAALTIVKAELEGQKMVLATTLK